MTKPSWDRYFMDIAVAVAARGTCNRLKVGALLVRDNHILATGYNGAPTDWESCDESGHQLVKIGDDGRESCQRTIHAEENALLQCAIHGIACRNATLYTTAVTCYDCFKRACQATVKRIVYRQVYSSARNGGVDIAKLAAKLNIEMVHLPAPAAEMAADLASQINNCYPGAKCQNWPECERCGPPRL